MVLSFPDGNLNKLTQQADSTSCSMEPSKRTYPQKTPPQSRWVAEDIPHYTSIHYGIHSGGNEQRYKQLKTIGIPYSHFNFGRSCLFHRSWMTNTVLAPPARILELVNDLFEWGMSESRKKSIAPYRHIQTVQRVDSRDEKTCLSSSFDIPSHRDLIIVNAKRQWLALIVSLLVSLGGNTGNTESTRGTETTR